MLEVNNFYRRVGIAEIHMFRLDRPLPNMQLHEEADQRLEMKLPFIAKKREDIETAYASESC